MAGGADIRPLVLIPVHKRIPDALERISLRQCGKVLGHHDVCLLAPDGLDLSVYAALLPTAVDIRVDPAWMSSRDAYNRMMISPRLYERLADYSHLLVHEPDAIVFRDELLDWCAGGHDYIGAPWFEGFRTASPGLRIECVGNFGLSLHRLDAIRQVLSSSGRWYPVRYIVRDLVAGWLKRDVSRFRRAWRARGGLGQLRHAWRGYGDNCDLFWALVVPPVFASYRVAPVEAAMRFAWEVHPRVCMSLCQDRLPFGLHAWARYDLAFLWPHMLAAGVDMSGIAPPEGVGA